MLGFVALAAAGAVFCIFYALADTWWERQRPIISEGDREEPITRHVD